MPVIRPSVAAVRQRVCVPAVWAVSGMSDDIATALFRAQQQAAIEAIERFMDFLVDLPPDSDYLGEAMRYQYQAIKKLERKKLPC